MPRPVAHLANLDLNLLVAMLTDPSRAPDEAFRPLRPSAAYVPNGLAIRPGSRSCLHLGRPPWS